MIDTVKLGNDVQTNFRGLVLQQLEEKRQKIIDGDWFAENRSQAANMIGQGSANVLRVVMSQVFDARHDVR